MTKNVSVIDESGKLIGTTYPKRAKGLVKCGRARYVSWGSEDTICLTCPPENTEDNLMTDNSLDIALAETNNAAEEPVSSQNTAASRTPSAEYALYMLECIAKDTEAIKGAVMKVSDVTDNGIAHIIESREKTNRELITFYTQMYNEYKPIAPANKSNTVTRFEEIAAMLKRLNRSDYDEDAWDTLMEAAQAQLSRNY